MKALTLLKNRHLILKDCNIPEPDEDQVRIKVKKAGICASDIAYWKNGSDRLKLPVILGHEISGIVDKVGKNVMEFYEGERVIPLTTFKICKECRFCSEGAYNLCLKREGIGSKANGGFAEYLVVPKYSVLRIPDNVSFEEAAMTEPLACAVHALTEQTSIKEGAKVLVIGPGPIGLLAAQVAKTSGAFVIVCGIDKDNHRLQIAKEKLGVDLAVNSQREDLKSILNKLTNSYGPDVIVECSGSYQAINMSLDLIAKKGVLIQLGIPHENGIVNYPTILFKELIVVGSASQVPSSWDKSIELIKTGKINVKDIISHQFPLNLWENGFNTTLNKLGLKVLLDPYTR